jgi:hypothetical protein
MKKVIVLWAARLMCKYGQMLAVLGDRIVSGGMDLRLRNDPMFAVVELANEDQRHMEP